MKPESSKKSKTVASHKFCADQEDEVGRHFQWSRELFIELTLSPRQVQKVKRWEKAHHSIVPIWYANFKRVLFVDQESLDEFLLKKHREAQGYQVRS